MHELKRFFTWAAILATLAGFLYAPTGSFAFLHLDDQDYTFRCAFVFDGLSWANVKAAFLNVRHAGVWMPVTYISYMLDISLFGASPGPHHLVNAALHAAATFLLLALAWRLARGGNAMWILLAAAFWAFHPQRVEAVAWIAGRKELLWAVFALAGMLFWERGQGHAARAGAYACCAMACMSKPTAMCFPLLALAVDVMKTDRAPDAQVVAGRIARLRLHVASYLPLVAMSIATGALAAYSQTHPAGHEVRALFGASLPWRLLNAMVSTGLSISQAVFPVGIHLDYRAVPGHFPLHGVQGLLVFGLAACAWAALRILRGSSIRRFDGPLVWFFVALLPTLGIFGSFGEHARADRFLYVPMMFVVLAAAIMLRGCSGAPRRVPPWIAFGACIAVVALAVAAWPVVDSYRSDKAAFSRTLEFDLENGRALAHVGQAVCAERGGIDKGIDMLRRSQALRPRDSTAAQLAFALAMRGHSADFGEIRNLCDRFARDHGLDAKGQALEALGMTALRQRKWAEAATCLEDSIRAPGRFYSADDAKLRLACAYANGGRPKDAIRILETLLASRRPDVKGKAAQALETLRHSPKAVLFLD